MINTSLRPSLPLLSSCEALESRLLNPPGPEGVVSRLRTVCHSTQFDLVQAVIQKHQERLLHEMNRDASHLEGFRVTQLQPAEGEGIGPKKRILCLEGIHGLTSQFLTKGPKLPPGAYKDVRPLVPCFSSSCRNPPLAIAKLRTIRKDPNLPEGVETPLSQLPFDANDIANFYHEANVSRELQARGNRYALKIWKTSYEKAEKASERLVMEYCNGGHLGVYLRRECDVLKRMRLGLQLVQGLLEMHESGYSHGDLKIPNILVIENGENPEIRIADFGTSRRMGEPMGPFGTFPAPEVFEHDPSEERFRVQPSLDLWALADILHFLRFGTTVLQERGLFFSLDPEEFMARAKEVKSSFREIRHQLHEPLVDCIACLFSSHPHHRPSLREVLDVVRTWVSQQEALRSH